MIILSVNCRPFFCPTIVIVLIVCAFFAWIDAIEQIQAIRQRAAFNNRVAISINELTQAISEMSKP